MKWCVPDLPVSDKASEHNGYTTLVGASYLYDSTEMGTQRRPMQRLGVDVEWLYRENEFKLFKIDFNLYGAVADSRGHIFTYEVRKFEEFCVYNVDTEFYTELIVPNISESLHGLMDEVYKELTKEEIKHLIA